MAARRRRERGVGSGHLTIPHPRDRGPWGDGHPKVCPLSWGTASGAAGTCAARTSHLLRTVRLHFGARWIDRSATHPRFVVRNTLSICAAFGLGWVGLWNVMPAYASAPASTVSVVIYTYTGASVPITLRRLSGACPRNLAKPM